MTQVIGTPGYQTRAAFWGRVSPVGAAKSAVVQLGDLMHRHGVVVREEDGRCVPLSPKWVTALYSEWIALGVSRNGTSALRNWVAGLRKGYMKGKRSGPVELSRKQIAFYQREIARHDH